MCSFLGAEVSKDIEQSLPHAGFVDRLLSLVQ